MENIKGRKIAILATDGYERSELMEPRDRLSRAGAKIEVISPKDGKEIRSWDKTDWGDSVKVDREIGEARIGEYDALVVPGGVMNPDHMRVDGRAVNFVRDFLATGKPTAVICHGPWMLVEADVLEGRRVTSYHTIRTDLVNAGGDWVDEPVVVDGNLITSRNPDDLPAFCDKIAEMLAAEVAAESP